MDRSGGTLMTTVEFRAARTALEQADRQVTDKVVSAQQAIELIKDGDHVAIGGTLYSRSPMALVFALIKARRTGLTISRPLTCYEAELLLATGSSDHLVTSWVGIGLQWGLPRVFRSYVESGRATYDEWSHLAMGLRFKAGAMGVPYLPSLTMLGSDLAGAVGLETVTCPYTGEILAAVPALNPDVALLHVHRADRFGNAQVDGYRHMDVDMARAAKRVVISAEEIVAPEEIQARPGSTMLPHFAVDAVVRAPFGAYPNECYGLYEADMAHFDTYVEQVKANGEDGARAYVAEHIDAHEDHAAFLAAVGAARLDECVAAAKALLP
jgi:glutaconate CoA-transferase subunit A